MTPKTYFDDVWQRCELFVALHGYVVAQGTGALQPDELLRAEWAARVSALDLYVHELVTTHRSGYSWAPALRVRDSGDFKSRLTR